MNIYNLQIMFVKNHKNEIAVNSTIEYLKYSRFRDILMNSNYHGKKDYMDVTYKKLFHLLIDRGIATSELIDKAGFSANILTCLRCDQYISLESIEKICLTLNCKVDDILEFNQ